MLFHVHHIDTEGHDRVRESFLMFEPAKRLAQDLVATYGGETYVTRGSVVQWDSNAAMHYSRLDYAEQFLRDAGYERLDLANQVWRSRNGLVDIIIRQRFTDGRFYFVTLV